MEKLSAKKHDKISKTGSCLALICACGCMLAMGLQPTRCFADSNPVDQLCNSSARTDELLVQMPLLSDPCAADRLISLDFDGVDIRAFIKTIGHLTGVNFLIDESVRGTVTLVCPTKIPVGKVYEQLESVLQSKGYAALSAGQIVKIVPRQAAIKSNSFIHIGNDPEQIPIDDSIRTQMIHLHFADAAEVTSLLTPLLSTDSSIITYPKANAIILTDTSATIHRVASLLRELDVQGVRENITMIPLKHASARSISEQITQIMQQGTVGPSPQPTRGAAASVPTMTKVLSDDRTNSLIVVATHGEVETVRGLVEQLDVERPLETGNLHVIYLRHAEAKELEKSLPTVLDKLTAGKSNESREPSQITADESTNSLIIVASAQDYTIIEDMVAKLDIVREQVLVEFQIVEASDDTLREIGVDWATLDEAVAESVRGFGFTNLGPRVEAISGDLEGLGVGVYKKVADQTKIGAILKALERHSGVNILSTPHVLTSNHKKASIVVADNVPYVKESRVTEFDPATPTAIRTFDFKDVGIELNVTPHISQGGFVRLEIDASFSKLIEGTTGLGTETPTTAQRKANTVVSIMSGATVVMGGLMRDDKQTVEKKIPLLGDLPLIGGLFRMNKDRVQKTNLLLFITPYVMSDKEDLTEITELKRRQAEKPGLSEKDDLAVEDSTGQTPRKSE